MFHLLDQVLESGLRLGWTPTPAKPGIRFAVPDEIWWARVKQGLKLMLNIYLLGEGKGTQLNVIDLSVSP